MAPEQGRVAIVTGASVMTPNITKLLFTPLTCRSRAWVWPYHVNWFPKAGK